MSACHRRAAWEGSLNILSHNSTEEQMRRFVGQNTVEEIINNLELDQELGGGNPFARP
ncbi:MAG: hypothetical protein GX971_09250 [Firmicutes bacterium]|nr:hypothetical protein [Bacillota bacterium]